MCARWGAIHCTAARSRQRLPTGFFSGCRRTPLSTAGYVMERRCGGASKCYRLMPAHIAHTFQALESWLSDPHGAQEEPGEQEATRTQELGRFLDSSGRLITWPAKRRDQL